MIEPGNFGDCWIKVRQIPVTDSHGKLKSGLCDFNPFNASQLSVRGPGQHHGGKQWWVEPLLDVLVVVPVTAS